LKSEIVVGSGGCVLLPALAAGRGAARLGAWDLDRIETSLQSDAFLARGNGHGLDRLELLAAHHVHSAHPLAHALAEGGFGLAPHAGERARGAVHQFGEIIEEAVFGLHRLFLNLPAAAPTGPPYRVEKGRGQGASPRAKPPLFRRLRARAWRMGKLRLELAAHG